MFLSPLLKHDEIKKSLETNGMSEIKDFLQSIAAESLYEFYTKKIDPTWWTYSQKHLGRLDYASVRLEAVVEDFKQGHFTYRFKRTMSNHYPTCLCIQCQFLNFLKSPDFLAFLAKINRPGDTVGEVFASLYNEGDFLSPHTDKDKGKIGFILYLTKDWKPQYGGNLHFLSEDCTKIVRTVTPSFNKLMLFDIDKYNGIPHFVSHVQKDGRLAISGWYS